MDKIEVTVRFDLQGQITPINFTWKDQTYPVISTGRRWSDGQTIHILVMIPSQRIFELVYAPIESYWYLLSVGLERSAI